MKNLVIILSIILTGLESIAGTGNTPRDLPQVLIIGDSISVGYTPYVKTFLQGKANVVRIRGNAGPTVRGVKYINTWIGKEKWDIIFFNWGLWDLYGWNYPNVDHSLPQYEKRLEQLVSRLEKTGATLIWGTTTPCCTAPELTLRDYAKRRVMIAPEMEKSYRDTALKVMRKHKIKVSDLYTFMAPQRDHYALAADNVHYTQAGYKALGREVALSIEEEILKQRSGTPLVFVFTGESNSGGRALNTPMTPAELEKRPSVQIMNLTNGRFNFEPLHIGYNNLRDHIGLEKFYTIAHGFENGLAEVVEAGVFPGHSLVYLVKTGHGGSRAIQWQSKEPGSYWYKFVERIEMAKKQLPPNSKWVVWFSLGINDGIAKTPIETWKKLTSAYLKRIKEQLPGAIIIMTGFQSMGFPETNEALEELASRDSDIFTVNSKGARLINAYHWDYEGNKTLVRRMADLTRQELEKRGGIKAK